MAIWGRENRSSVVAYFSGNEAFGLGNYKYDKQRQQREWGRNTGCTESLKTASWRCKAHICSTRASSGAVMKSCFRVSLHFFFFTFFY